MCGFQFKNNAYWNIAFVQACFSLSNLPRVANILITLLHTLVVDLIIFLSNFILLDHTNPN